MSNNTETALLRDAEALSEAIEELHRQIVPYHHSDGDADADADAVLDRVVSRLSGSTLECLHGAVLRAIGRHSETFEHLGKVVRARVEQVGAEAAMAELDEAERMAKVRYRRNTR
jgi:hypothetical protein